MFCLRGRYSSGKEKAPYFCRYVWLSMRASQAGGAVVEQALLAVPCSSPPWVGRLVVLCGAALRLSFRKVPLLSTVCNHSSKYLPELQLIATQLIALSVNELRPSLICICCSCLYFSHDQLFLERYLGRALHYIPVGYEEGLLITFYLPAVLLCFVPQSYWVFKQFCGAVQLAYPSAW